MTARKKAPTSVIRTITCSRNSAVLRPGRMPGTKEPCSFMLFAISVGWNISDVQKYEKKMIRPV